jgi:hypothetical protein
MTHVLELSREETHLVKVGALRVLIHPDGDGWYAQGIEIDYAATGGSVDEVKHNFEIGLARTIDLHLERWGTVKNLLKFAPPSEWEELLGGQGYKFSMTITHQVSTVSEKIPFQSIAYLQAAALAN